MNFSSIQTIENIQEVSGFSLTWRLKYTNFSGPNVGLNIAIFKTFLIDQITSKTWWM